MATVIESFLVGIGIKPDTGSFASIKGQFAGVTKVIGATMLAIKGAQTLFTGAVLGMANSLDALSDAAGRVDTTAEALDKLNYIASQTDSSSAAVESSLIGIGRAAGNANIGMKEFQDSFKRAGIDIKNADGTLKDSVTLLYEIGGAMKKLSKVEQLSLAQKLQIDTTMIGTLTGDLEGLSKEYETFARLAGGSLDEAAQASSDLMDEVGKMKTFGTMLTRSVMTEFIFKLRDGFIGLRQWALDNADRIKKVIQAILGFISRAGDTISSIFRRVGILMRKAIDWWDGLSDASKDATKAIAGVAGAIWLINKAWTLSPVGLFISALTALFVLYDDFVTFIEGGQSLFDWRPYVDDINAVLDAVSALWNEIVRFTTWLLQNADFSFILESATKAVRGIIELFKGLGKVLKGAFTLDAGMILDGLQGIVAGARKILLAWIDWITGLGKLIATALLYAFDLDIGPFIDTISRQLKVLVNVVADIVGSIVDFFRGLVQVIRGIFAGDLGAIFEGLGEMAKAVVNVIKAVFLGLVDTLANAVAFIGNLIGIDLTGVFNSFRSFFAGCFDFVGGLIDSVVDKFKNFLGWAEKGVNALKRFFGIGGEDSSGGTAPPIGNYKKAGSLGASTADFAGTLPLSHGAATGTSVSDNSRTEQKNDFNIRNEFHITGTGDPQETANRVEMKQRDVARNMTSVVVPMPKHQSAFAGGA